MADPITLISNWLSGLLRGWGLSSGAITVIMTIIGVVAIATFVLVLDIFLVWVERKVVARFQDRLGPNRLGPYGLIQPLADVVKLLIKEELTPPEQINSFTTCRPSLRLPLCFCFGR